jgi:2,4-dichlorophenol 6-monooxygenase
MAERSACSMGLRRRVAGYVTFRHATATASPQEAERLLTEAVRRILGHG